MGFQRGFLRKQSTFFRDSAQMLFFSERFEIFLNRVAKKKQKNKCTDLHSYPDRMFRKLDVLNSQPSHTKYRRQTKQTPNLFALRNSGSTVSC
jgi:hypothetical protein